MTMALSSKRYENVVRYYYLPAEKCALIQVLCWTSKIPNKYTDVVGLFACRFFWSNMEFLLEKRYQSASEFLWETADICFVGFVCWFYCFLGFFSFSNSYFHFPHQDRESTDACFQIWTPPENIWNCVVFMDTSRLLKWDWEQQRAGTGSHIRNSSNGTALVSWQ